MTDEITRLDALRALLAAHQPVEDDARGGHTYKWPEPAHTGADEGQDAEDKEARGTGDESRGMEDGMKVFTVYCDGEGQLSRIAETPGFAAENTLFRADVLKDIALAFADRYADAHAALMQEWEQKRTDAMQEAQ